jgi:hypothetical protein
MMMEHNSTASSNWTQCVDPEFYIGHLFDTPHELYVKANTIHVVFGVFLIIITTLWSVYTSRLSVRGLLCCIPLPCVLAILPRRIVRSRVLGSLPLAYILSGLLFISAGLYLILMVFFFLRVDRLDALWRFAVRDLTQLQHTAIGLCLMGQGSAEIAFSLSLPMNERAKLGWHTLALVNGVSVGALFTVHHQHSLEMAKVHIGLGMALEFGHIFWTAVKLGDFNQKHGAKLFEMIAGVFFGVGCVCLFSYREPDMNLCGILIERHPAKDVTYAAIFLGTASVIGSAIGIIRVKWFQYKKGEEDGESLRPSRTYRSSSRTRLRSSKV